MKCYAAVLAHVIVDVCLRQQVKPGADQLHVMICHAPAIHLPSLLRSGGCHISVDSISTVSVTYGCCLQTMYGGPRVSTPPTAGATTPTLMPPAASPATMMTQHI